MGCALVRYELWCIARSASVRYCVVHCSVPKETAWAWNQARAEATLPAAASKTEGTPSGAAVGEKGTPSAPARQEQVTPHTAAAAQEEGTPLAEAAAREEGTPSAAKQADSYSREVFEDLWRRHEEPDSRNRWDQPLFRLDPADRDSMAPALQVRAHGCQSFDHNSLKATIVRPLMLTDETLTIGCLIRGQ